jgi:hypothetical protein
MNKIVTEPPKIYGFIYELGKMKHKDRIEFVKDVKFFLVDYLEKLETEWLINKYPEFKLGEEARDAKAKVENLTPNKPKKKKTKEKK